MAVPMLKVSLREDGGRRNVKRLRRNGFIPGVVYGHNKKTKAVKINKVDLDRLISRYGKSGTVNMELDGEVMPVIIKELQRGVVKDGILHVDLQQLSADEKVKLNIPINLVGKELVESSATILQQQLMSLEVPCLPKYIPQSIVADVSGLNMGEALEVRNLDIYNDENIDVLNEGEEIVASIISASREEVVEEENDIPIYESTKSILDN